MNYFCWMFQHAHLGNYADDNTLNAIFQIMNQVICILEAEGQLVLEWFEEKNMKTNHDKFQCIRFGQIETETESACGRLK